jgi:hypothetical protein
MRLAARFNYIHHPLNPLFSMLAMGSLKIKSLKYLSICLHVQLKNC